MCGTCGCGDGSSIAIENRDGTFSNHPQVGLRTHHHDHDHHHGNDHDHTHEHDHDHPHSHSHSHDHPPSPGRAEIGPTPRVVQVERDLLEKNQRFAAANRRLFAASGVTAVNLMSSPGSGKTTLLVETLKELIGEVPVAVIEGDQQTSFDADRIRATGAAAVQINTGKVCHLDASMITEAFGALDPPGGGFLFIENVGNLVCPAGFDLGEAARVVVVSVTEGEDKPLKYPDMFARADLVVVNKVDLLPHLDFDLPALVSAARRVNPGVAVLEVSARSGEGLRGWLEWLERRRSLR